MVAPKKITAPELQARKQGSEKISVVTAYDYTFARILDEAGVDALLVGDSLGMVVQGHATTLPVTLEQMIYHCECVARGAKRAHVICDLPFLSYQTSKSDALRAAGLALKQGQAQSVKMEGGEEIAELVLAATRIGIPVMGHVGLMPQHVQRMGGYKVQGRDKDSAKRILQDAKAIAEAGAYALVLEGIPQALAKEITRAVGIPTIGIGSGPHCDGQVLVIYDLLGMVSEIAPKFVKKYADLNSVIGEAVREYREEVQKGIFPGEKNSY